MRTGVRWRHRTVDRAIWRCAGSSGNPPRCGKSHSSNRLTDRVNRDYRAEFRARAIVSGYRPRQLLCRSLNGNSLDADFENQ